MPADPSMPRLLAGSLVAVMLLSGCQTLGDAGQVIDRAELVNDLASRLDRSTELTYSADYQLSGGQTASIVQAQKPVRAAYTYPGGKLTVTDEATVICVSEGELTCTITPPPSPSAKPAITVFQNAGNQGLVTPTLVINMLTTAALDADAIIEQTDTTIAGRHATCVKVGEVADTAAANFTACVTTEGVLGSFRGVVEGKPVELAMSRLRDAVDPTAFEVPAEATVVDQRAGNP
ncbi:hypothetical protein [Polymorphospora rubra]|uniref:Lipoprotein n=1 Tax=Polymorphospora rubra TaxID=338584 RepID=A0A810MTM0_9ACTN|nr:hypothetical protein [Polymorphospora rubra]BCJ64421.1 hypothetical protein Prubr_14420 [Polymorphospora rubra]